MCLHFSGNFVIISLPFELNLHRTWILQDYRQILKFSSEHWMMELSLLWGAAGLSSLCLSPLPSKQGQYKTACQENIYIIAFDKYCKSGFGFLPILDTQLVNIFQNKTALIFLFQGSFMPCWEGAPPRSPSQAPWPRVKKFPARMAMSLHNEKCPLNH